MISNFLLVLGVGVLSAALRTMPQAIFRRLSALGIVSTSFLAGWLLGGSVWLGAALAVSWLFLPWLELLTRVRRMRLPIDRRLEPRTPPARSTFPGFSEVTDAIEEVGFEHVGDIGWDFEDNRHFYRVSADETRKLQAGICLVEQNELAFYYLTVTSRTADGRIFITWNYPFSYGLKIQPRVKMNRVPGHLSFREMVDTHEAFLRAEGVRLEDCVNQNPEETVTAMQQEMRLQITHNIDAGLLRRDGEHFIRYTARGMLFLWMQFLRDLVRTL
jgi:hypothetical protein